MPESNFSFTAEVRPVCELGLSDVREAEPDTWEDVSCYVHEVELFRGRERFNDRFEAATASISFDNRTGWGDLVGAPLVVASQKLRPGRQMRVGVVGPWGTRWLFRGWVDRCEPKYDPVLHDIVVADCIDALGEAGSTIAPLGPIVGANETVDARLNRVLDSVGWFPTKRTIDASATTVISTQLGQRAIDMLSQAADSAGGVVHGDLAGNVVFKDLDWELFDPDVPPDGGIGNVDPGTPGIPGGPGYIDPDPGYVYDPAPPPFNAATTVKVCADGTEGTLVQQGESFHIYAQDGRLLFSSSGHTWDLGDFDGGCVAVSFDPDTGDVTRWDDPDDDGVYQIAPFPAVELPQGFGLEVELLAYAQGGIADGLQSSVTVGPVTPGPDCMLFLLFCAGNGTVGAQGLRPFTSPATEASVTGGGLPWVAQPLSEAQYYYSEGSYPGSGAYLTYVVVGRDDPGTFSVTIDWYQAQQSKWHAVALYRARGCSPSLYDRLKNAYRGYAAADHDNNGDGVITMRLWDGFAVVPIQIQPTDVTLALSAAETTVPPFGATFGGAGDWTIPPLVSDIPRELSWNTGMRTNTLSPDVVWSDVNIGSEDIRSAQVVVNVEPSYARLFSWKVISWAVNAPVSGTIASGQSGLSPHADAGSLLVVFFSVTADHDMADALVVNSYGPWSPSLAFTRRHVQHKTGSSWGQGAIFTAPVPVRPPGEDFDAAMDVLFSWVGHTINSYSVVMYEVTNPGATAATGGGTLGTHTANSVDGPASITLGAAPASTSVVLSTLHVSTIATTAGDNAQSGGDDYVQEFRYTNPNRAYFHTQSRGPGEATSTDPVVDWNDVHTGATATYSGVAMGIEIGSGPDFVMYSEETQQLVIGGLTDPWQGTITSAERVTGLDPNIGDLLWSLDPATVVLP